MEKLVRQLHAICDEQPYVTSWYVKHFGLGIEADRDGTVIVPSASTRKTSIMMAVLRAAHQGKLDLDEPIVYEPWMKEDVVAGTFMFLTPGLKIPFRDAVTQMIILSDNVCTNMVFERIGLPEINDFCQSIGMTGTVHRTRVPRSNLPPTHDLNEVTTTTAVDQGLLYDYILRGTRDPEVAERLGCSTELCTWALKTLSGQRTRTKLPCLLPSGTQIAHKGGTGKRGRHDAGIVFRDGKPLYILAVFTDKVPSEMPDGLPGYASAFTTIGRLARACWDADVQ